MRLTRIHMEEDAGKNLHARRRRQLRRLQPRRRPAVRDRQRARHALAPRRRPSTCAPCARWCATSASATATWRRARSAATPTCRCACAAQTKYGTKAEIKNINSFKNVRDAIEHEVKRQAALLDRGERVVQETRLWDAARGVTRGDALEGAGARLPLFPRARPAAAGGQRRRPARRRARRCPSCPRIASRATRRRRGCRRRTRACWSPSSEIAGYFDATVAAGAPPKRAANWVINEVLARVDDPRKLGDADVAGAAGGAGRADRAHRGGHDLGQAGQGRLRAHVDRAPRAPATSSRPRGWRRSPTAARSKRRAASVVAANPDEVGALPRRQPQADGLLRGRGHEGDRRQGQPEDASTRSCDACWTVEAVDDGGGQALPPGQRPASHPDVLSPVFWRDGRVVMLDQRRLPDEEIWTAYDTWEDVARAIADMEVRGAPAIGCAGAFAVALAGAAARRRPRRCAQRMRQIGETRPTAVNLGAARAPHGERDRQRARRRGRGAGDLGRGSGVLPRDRRARRGAAARRGDGADPLQRRRAGHRRATARRWA